MKKAIIFGASGLVGNCILKLLIADSRYEQIIIFLRKPLNYNNPKVAEVISDLKDLKSIQVDFTADEIYCCLGTTISNAGSKEAFRKVDYNLPLAIGNWAQQNTIQKLLVVSSLGADSASKNFYLKTKGEMERDLIKLDLNRLSFFRPSMLLGERTESRPTEAFGKFMMNALSFIFVGPLKKYKAIPANTVAKAMIYVANMKESKQVYESEELFELG